jgi:phosphatidylserine decarboxylase
VERTSYISGDTWNVNPIALKRIEKLFCKNERAIVRTRLAANGDVVTLVPVAAILVASIHLNWLKPSSVRQPIAPAVPCPTYRKGEEMGRFEHGSTIIVFVPRHFGFAAGIETGARIRMGEPLFDIVRQDDAARHQPET